VRGTAAWSASHLRLAGRHLRLAWPVFVVFLAQRLLTVAFVHHQGGELSRLVTRWDAGWYLRLAESGYLYPNYFPDGRVRASNLAYFPLFPWLVRRVEDISPLSMSQALLAVSWLGGLLAVWAIFAVGHALYGRWAGVALAALWGMAPASLALTMGYPEGMFTAAAAGTLYCLLRRRPVWAGACALVAGLLRPSAVAVIAMVGVYFLVELIRWRAQHRPRAENEVMTQRPDPRDIGGPPVRAFIGAALSTVGLAAFMVYVGIRTGEVFGYFTVQAQWGQETASTSEYVEGIARGLFDAEAGSTIPLTIAASMVYVLLFCLILFDRTLVWASVYAAGILVMSLTHITFQHVYGRQLLPAFVLLIPLARMRVPPAGAVAALVLGSVVMSWGGAHFLLTTTAAL